MNAFGELGQVYVYEPEKLPRMPWLKRCMSRAAETLRSLPSADPLGPEAMRRYFELLYDVEQLDKKEILPRLNRPLTPDLYFPFREIAREFRFIEDDTIGVILPLEPEAKALVRELRKTDFPKTALRRLQQYSVSLRNSEFAALDAAGALEIVRGEFPVLQNLGAYGKEVGLCVEQAELSDVEELIF